MECLFLRPRWRCHGAQWANPFKLWKASDFTSFPKQYIFYDASQKVGVAIKINNLDKQLMIFSRLKLICNQAHFLGFSHEIPRENPCEEMRGVEPTVQWDKLRQK